MVRLGVTSDGFECITFYFLSPVSVALTFIDQVYPEQS
jgi:hypothetical protein